MADTKTSITLRFDYRWVIAALLLVIAAMVVLWRPWEARYDRDARTVTVTGETVVKAVPDEYQFYPNYNFKDADQATARTQATAKSTEIIAKLKELGVTENNIKTAINSYPDYDSTGSTGKTVYTLSVTITVKDKDLMQKLLDYILTTNPEGGVTPQPNFSAHKRKELEKQARDQATKEARQKADQSARNLGFRVADVKSVNDGAGFGDTVPMYAMTADVGGKSSTASSFMPGENELHYNVTVEYYIR